jgi:GntR family transcriptional regulator
VVRAYRELELEGFIYTRKGKGCYVSDNTRQLIQEEQTKILTRVFDEAIKTARKFDFNTDEIKKLLEKRVSLI